MKTKLFTLLTLVVFGFNISNAQDNEECASKLSIFHEYVVSKNFEAAFEPWTFVKDKCPNLNLAIYVDGEKILNDKIEKAQGADKTKYIGELMKLWDMRLVNFPDKSNKGQLAAQAAQLVYDNNDLYNKSKEELYKSFDDAYTLDKETFTNPKSLYSYFSLTVDLFDEGKRSAQDLFDKYDDVAEKIESEVKNYSDKLNVLIAKEETGETLSSKDQQYKNFYESYLGAYDKVASGIDTKLGDRANCETLISLYSKEFELNKDNAKWLQRAAGKMSEKECTSDPLFFKLVNAYHTISPSANSAYYLGVLKDKEGKSSEAITFYEQAISLESDNFKKSKLYNRIGLKLKKDGNFGKARSYFRQAIQFNPSNGNPYLSIASMYANSANSCGDSNFNKRAVYWLAAEEASKAGKADPNLRSVAAQAVASYMATAPQKSDIFSSGNEGKTIQIGCWIGASVTVPKIK